MLFNKVNIVNKNVLFLVHKQNLYGYLVTLLLEVSKPKRCLMATSDMQLYKALFWIPEVFTILISVINQYEYLLSNVQ